MTAHFIIPADVLATAPRVWVDLGGGRRVSSVDPDWRRAWEARWLDAQRAAQSEKALRVIRAASKAVEGPGRAIIAEVAESHGVTVADIVGPRRFAKIVAARMHAAFEIDRRLGWSRSRIGRALGGRDHSTISHAVATWPARAAQLGIATDTHQEAA